MGLIKRITRIFKAYANKALDSAESQSAMLEQTVIEHEENCHKTKTKVAQIMAIEKELQRKVKEKKEKLVQSNKNAKLALQKGDEDLARKILETIPFLETEIETMETELTDISLQVTEAKTMVSNMEDKLIELKHKKAVLETMIQTTEVQENSNRLLASIQSKDSDGFGKIEEKIRKRREEAKAMTELNASSTDYKLTQLNAQVNSVDVDERLAKLKEELNGEKSE